MEQVILCHDSTTCYCHRTACFESLRWFIHLCLFTDKTPQLGLKPYGASNAREVGGILHPAGQLLGRLSRGIWPAWISSAGWNRGVQTESGRQSASISAQYKNTWEPWERAVKNHGESCTNIGAQSTWQHETTTHTFVICFKLRTKLISSK